MNVKYSKPAPNESYLICKKLAKKIARDIVPELNTLNFQTKHCSPKSDSALFLATLSRWSLDILSIKEQDTTEALIKAFELTVFPEACRKVKWYMESAYAWRTVMVAIENKIYCVSASEGMQFPSIDEIEAGIRKDPHPICEL